MSGLLTQGALFAAKKALPVGLFLGQRWLGSVVALPVATALWQTAGANPAAWADTYTATATVTTTLGPVLGTMWAGTKYRILGVGDVLHVQTSAIALAVSGALTVGLDVLQSRQTAALTGTATGIRPVVWLAAALAAAAAYGLAKLFMSPPGRFRLSLRRKEPVRRLEGGPWRAAWMPIADAFTRFSAPAGLIIGEAHRYDDEPDLAGKVEMLRWAPTGHLLTVAGSGAGKGTSLVVPNALTWPKALVITDPAGETLDKVQTHRKAMGRKLRVLSLDDDTDGMNVLDWLDPKSPRFIEDVRAVVDLMALEQSGGGDDKNAGFKACAKNLIACLVLYVLTAPEMKAPRTLTTVRSFFAREDLLDLLRDMATRHDLAHGAVADLAGGVLKFANAQETLSGVLFNVESYTSFLLSPAKDRLLSGNVAPEKRFSVTDILCGDTDVFICLPVTTLTAEPQVGRLIIGALLTTIYNHNNRIPDTLFLLDEMPRLGPMKALATARDFSRKLGVILWAVVQDLGQLEDAWGKDGARGWLATPMLKSFFGVADAATAEMLSGMCGEYTAITESVSENAGNSRNSGEMSQGLNTGYSKNTQGQQVPLISKSEVLGMAANEDGMALEQLVLFRGAPPLRCGMAHYFRRPELAALVDGTKFVRV